MFCEGKCINEWHLRPFRKGTARLAISSWQEGIDVRVLPVGINYSSFRKFGKNIFLNFGAIISKDAILGSETDGKRNLIFNDKLKTELEKLVFEIPADDLELKKKLLTVKQSGLSKIILTIPAIIGLLLNAPLYLPVRYFVRTKTKDSDHHDSVLLALLIFFYPVYILLLTSFCFSFIHSWLSLFVILVLPFTAWAYVQLKKQVD
jgi:hypothetical protein